MATIEQLLGPAANSTMIKSLIGNPLIKPLASNEYGLFLLVIAAFLIIGGIFHFVIRGIFHNLTKKTKTDLDDKIFDIIKFPIFAEINIFGVYLALTTLSILDRFLLYIEGAFFVLSALIAALVLSKVVSLIVARAIAAQDGGKAPKLVMMVVNVIIYLGILLVILSHFGVDITAGIAALGVGGIAIGLALQGTLRDFFSGLHIVTDKPINVGDYIEIHGENVEGFVMDVGWRSTRIRTLPDNIIIVPNSKLADSIIVNNYLADKEVGFTVDCGVAYDSDLEKVERLTLEVAREIQGSAPSAVRTYEPLFRYKEFGDSNINFYVVLRINDITNKYSVRSAFIKALKKRFDEEGIEISWPVRKIFYGDGKRQDSV